jgi:hypothetical protein
VLVISQLQPHQPFVWVETFSARTVTSALEGASNSKGKLRSPVNIRCTIRIMQGWCAPVHRDCLRVHLRQSRSKTTLLKMLLQVQH